MALGKSVIAATTKIARPADPHHNSKDLLDPLHVLLTPILGDQHS